MHVLYAILIPQSNVICMVVYLPTFVSICVLNLQDVVYALAHATGKTGRFSLTERWRNNERLLSPQDQPLQVYIHLCIQEIVHWKWACEDKELKIKMFVPLYRLVF